MPIQPSREDWKMTEDELLAAVVSRCEELGIYWVHIDAPHHNRRRQNLIGFPDLFLCGTGDVAFRELKRQAGDMRPEQTGWKYRLLAAGANYTVWRPADLTSGAIERELKALCVNNLPR